MDRFSDDFFNTKEIGILTLEFIGSEQLKDLMENTQFGWSHEFKQGATWGMAMLMVYLNATATRFHCSPEALNKLNQETQKDENETSNTLEDEKIDKEFDNRVVETSKDENVDSINSKEKV